MVRVKFLVRVRVMVRAKFLVASDECQMSVR